MATLWTRCRSDGRQGERDEAARKYAHSLLGLGYPTFARRLETYLQRRGFSTSLIWRIVRQMWGEEGQDWSEEEDQLVPKVGVEPTRGCPQRFLSLKSLVLYRPPLSATDTTPDIKS